MGIDINANINVDALYPEFWAASFDALKIGSYNFQNLVSRNVEGQISRKGKTVHVPITADLGEADDWSPGGTISSTAIEQEMEPVTLSKSKKKTISLDDEQLSLSPYELIEQYGVPMAKTIIRAVNRDIYVEIMKTPHVVDATSGLTASSLIAARTRLSKNEVGSQRFAVLGPDDVGAMLNVETFQHADKAGDNEAQRTGFIRSKFSFDFFENNIIDVHTPSDVVGAINNSTGYAAGDTTINVDGFVDDAGSIQEGDMFKITGETGSPWHTVIAVAQTDSNTTGITFTPALESTVADDSAITITPTRSIVCYSPDALAFAARAYKEKEVGARSSIVNFMGVPVRITVWIDSTTLNTNVQYDILYGTKLIDPDKVCRILTYN